MKPAGRHYVYSLADPQSGEVFYIGKGQGKRAWQHEVNTRRGTEKNHLKAQRIRQILSAGLSVDVEVIASFDTAAEALALERALIERLGEGLTNIAGGRQCRLTVGLAFAESTLQRVIPREVYALTASPTELLLYDYLVSGLKVQINIFRFRLGHVS